MAGTGLDRPIKLSILDRLVEDHRAAGTIGAAADLGALREAVRRDLEWLLNTRRIHDSVPDAIPTEVRRSLYHYGFPDTLSLGRDTPGTRAKVLNQLEEAIALFEPRLSQVRIVPAKEVLDGRRRLRFVIHALLAAEPTPIRVAFDTAVDRGSGDINVKADDA